MIFAGIFKVSSLHIPGNAGYKPDYIMACKILEELRIELPDSYIPGFLRNHEIKVPETIDTPITLFIKEKNIIYKPRYENSIKKNEKPNYQKLYEDRQEEVIGLLKNVIEQIEDDISNYPCDYDDCEDDSTFESSEKFLTTFIGLMLNSEIEIHRKFSKLMELPLQKLNPDQFQNIIDIVSNILEYEYVFESGENSKTQKYPHYRVKYKEKNN